jgi:hypothetical protein
VRQTGLSSLTASKVSNQIEKNRARQTEKSNWRKRNDAFLEIGKLTILPFFASISLFLSLSLALCLSFSVSLFLKMGVGEWKLLRISEHRRYL